MLSRLAPPQRSPSPLVTLLLPSLLLPLVEAAAFSCFVVVSPVPPPCGLAVLLSLLFARCSSSASPLLAVARKWLAPVVLTVSLSLVLLPLPLPPPLLVLVVLVLLLVLLLLLLLLLVLVLLK
jgi:hypothetical protein